MIINADSILPLLKRKLRHMHSDGSRHVLCPCCRKRTKLHTLSDGRRKCSCCKKKFRIHKITEEKRLTQCAVILLCFCLDFSAKKTSQITGYRYRLVGEFYDHFRKLLLQISLPPNRIQLFTQRRQPMLVSKDKSMCKWCRNRARCGQSGHQPPLFGLKLSPKGEASIDVLDEEQTAGYAEMLESKEHQKALSDGYAGFICCDRFHRFAKVKRMKDGTEHLWAWISERMRSHHGIWKKNIGFYLKELEWKYNHRSLKPETQAEIIVNQIPDDCFIAWFQHSTLRS